MVCRLDYQPLFGNALLLPNRQLDAFATVDSYQSVFCLFKLSRQRNLFYLKPILNGGHQGILNRVTLLVNGKDVFVIQPTGSGLSIIFPTVVDSYCERDDFEDHFCCIH